MGERARAELRACGQTVRGQADGTVRLTLQEVQVARFVAEGLSNADVAARLFLSRAPSTSTCETSSRSSGSAPDRARRTRDGRPPLRTLRFDRSAPPAAPGTVGSHTGPEEHEISESHEDGLHVVVGASGGTGSAVVRELHAAGRRVRAINRSGRTAAPPGVEAVAADATDAAQMRRACAGAAVVYNCVNPPFARWRTVPGRGGRRARRRVGRGRGPGVRGRHLVYGRVTGPMTEDTPVRPVSGKGVLRAWLADRVLAAHHRGDVRAVVGRAGELFGPGVESVLARNLFAAALGGRNARWFGRLDQPLTPMFIDDFALGLITLAEQADAHGAVWHVPHPDPLSGRALVDMIFAAAGTPAPVTPLGTTAVRALGLVSSLARAGAEMVYQFEMPFVVDGSRFLRAFGAKTTPVDEAVAITLNWYRTNR